MSYPDDNIVESSANDASQLSDIVYCVLRQCCYKAVSLWEAVFDDVRAWMTQPRTTRTRTKTIFSQHKKTLAASLAMLSASIGVYGQLLGKYSGMVRVSFQQLRGFA